MAQEASYEEVKKFLQQQVKLATQVPSLKGPPRRTRITDKQFRAIMSKVAQIYRKQKHRRYSQQALHMITLQVLSYHEQAIGDSYRQLETVKTLSPMRPVLNLMFFKGLLRQSSGSHSIGSWDTLLKFIPDLPKPAAVRALLENADTESNAESEETDETVDTADETARVSKESLKEYEEQYTRLMNTRAQILELKDKLEYYRHLNRTLLVAKPNVKILGDDEGEEVSQSGILDDSAPRHVSVIQRNLLTTDSPISAHVTKLRVETQRMMGKLSTDQGRKLCEQISKHILS